MNQLTAMQATTNIKKNEAICKAQAKLQGI
jgi:hypothetical protein